MKLLSDESYDNLIGRISKAESERDDIAKMLRRSEARCTELMLSAGLEGFVVETIPAVREHVVLVLMG